jgi:hypothetical protein
VFEAQNPIPLPLTHCTVYVYIVYLFIQGRRGGLNQREGERGNYESTYPKAGLKIPT